jgi:hypothetical protein
MSCMSVVLRSLYESGQFSVEKIVKNKASPVKISLFLVTFHLFLVTCGCKKTNAKNSLFFAATKSCGK